MIRFVHASKGELPHRLSKDDGERALAVAYRDLKYRCHGPIRCGRRPSTLKLTPSEVKHFELIAAAQMEWRADGDRDAPAHPASTKKPKTAAKAQKKRKSASGKVALVIKRRWLNLILDRKKTWEIRGTPCNVRGLIKLAESGSNQLMGEAKVVDSISFKDFEEFKNHPEVYKSGIPADEMHTVKYRKIFAWVVEDAKRYKVPVPYKHHQGAVTWVKIGETQEPD